MAGTWYSWPDRIHGFGRHDAVSTALRKASWLKTSLQCPSTFKRQISLLLPHMTRQRALYHFIALGKTLPAHMYRNIGEDCSVEGIERFIRQKLSLEEENRDEDKTEWVNEIEDNQIECEM